MNNSNNETILLVDDDTELTHLMTDFLTSNGYQVKACADGAQVMPLIEQQLPDLIVLDLMLPGIDGLTLCKQIREHHAIPIIMLTALDDDIDEVTGLELGADDYLAKPTKPRVLLAHIRAQLRRHSLVNQLKEHEQEHVVCCDNAVEIDARKRSVTKHGEELNFSSAEFDLLWLLAQHIGEIISRDDLYQKILRLPYDGLDRTIDLRVSRIRKKLGDNPKSPSMIKTVRNTGYLLAP